MKYKEKQNEPAIYQEADVSSKTIFGNHTLCAQFLRDYSGLTVLANVQPEDIEDVSERYHLFREVELQADIILSTVRSLCRRLNLTAEETTDLLEKIRGGNMGYLWENMEKPSGRTLIYTTSLSRPGVSREWEKKR